MNSTNSAKVIQVIRTVSVTGDGTPNDPAREITEYWSFDGVRLAVHAIPRGEILKPDGKEEQGGI